MFKLDDKGKDTLAYIAAYTSLFVGFGLLIAGFCVPPVGEISNSVLCAFGEILVFVGSIIGIALHIDHRMGIVKSEVKGELKGELEEHIERRGLVFKDKE